MNRKQWSCGQGRRSSAPKRFSAALLETEDRNKNVSDGKKSFIPRPTMGSSRSSSVEREGLPSSSRGSQNLVRSTSAERIADENIKSSGRSRITESAFTPKHLIKSGCRNTVSVQRTVRKDTRPLTDRAFQMTALAKVEEYLVAKEIITPGPSLSNSMTLKLFVHIMNALLGVLFSNQQLTLSNYSELIPVLMRKLKYPGNITRSWLVTANSPHSWHHVLGLLSWLVDLVNLSPSDLKYNAEGDENVLDAEKAKKLFEFTTQRYLVWSVNEMPVSTEEDELFFDDLVADRLKPLKDNLEKVKKDLLELENLVRGTESSEEFSSEQKFKALKTDLEKEKSARNSLTEELRTLRIEVEKNKSKIQALLSKIADLKQCIAQNDCSDSFNAEEVAKLQSEAVSLRNIIKVRDTQVNDISNQCFSLDLTNARLQGKLDKVRLEREAILRGCTSQYINAEEFQLSLNYGNEENPTILSEYLTKIKNAKLHLESILKESIEKENFCKAQRKEAEEKMKSCECDIFNTQTKVQQLDLNLAEIKNKSAVEVSEIRKLKDEYSEVKRKQISLKHKEESASASLSELQEELKVCEQEFAEEEAKYLRILERMRDALHNHVKRCRELVVSVLDD